MTGSFRTLLVLLSILVAILASKVALDLTGRLSVASPRERRGWLAGGSLAMGVGMWSMHFIGMLAFHLPGVTLAYDVPVWLASVLVAVAASLVALWVASGATLGAGRLAAGGVLMGGGMAAMHYTGMAAIRGPVAVHYRPGVVALSLLVAVGAACAALYLAYTLRNGSGLRARWSGFGAATGMGLAMAGMHYTGMAAARFTPAPAPPLARAGSLLATTGLVSGVLVATLLVLSLAAVSVLLDRRVRSRLQENEALRSSERQLEEAQRLARLGSWEWQVGSPTLLASAELYRILGRDPADGPLQQEALRQLLDPEDQQLFGQAIDRAIRGGEPFSLDLRVPRAGGEAAVLYVRGRAVRNPAGRTLSLLGTTQDVTEARRASQSVTRSEAYFRALIENSKETITVVDAEGTVLFESPSVTSMLGHRPEDMVGRSIFGFLHPADLILARRTFQGVLSMGRAEPLDIRFRHAAGGWRVMRVISNNLLADPAVGGIVLNARDVTERRRADQLFVTEHSITDLLARAPTLDDAMPNILRTLVEGLDWSSATFWCADEDAGLLLCGHQSRRSDEEPDAAEALAARLVYLPGVGLPGEVWQQRASTWVEDIAADARIAHRDIAVLEGYRTAFVFPVMVGEDCFGVIEMLSRETVPQDRAMAAAMGSVGREIGQFLKRRRAEEALRRSERYYRSLTENVLDIISVLDKEGVILYKSPASLPELGYTPEELVGKNVFEYLHPRDVEAAREAFTQALQNPGTPRWVQVDFHHRNGSWQTLEVVLTSLIDDPAVGGVVANSRNVTARKHAEDRLRETGGTLATLIQSAPVPMVGLDAEARVTLWNPAAEALFGWRAEEVIGREYPLMPEDESPQPQSLKERLFANADRTTGVVVQRRTKGGVLLELLLHAVTVTDGEGKPAGAVGFFADLTERNRMEERMQRAEKLDAIGRLAGGVAHDFNNLLTAIKGNAQLALQDLEDGHPVRQDLLEIDRTADRATVLTRQLLAFGRKQVMRAEVLDLGGVVRQLEKMLRRLIGEDVELRTAIDPEAGTVVADAGQMEQVLVNLVVNARDAMPNGGKLRIAVEPGVFPPDAGEGGSRGAAGSRAVMLSVGDNGIGMDEAVRGRMFEPFFTTKAAGRGTGLGLATVYGIVQQNDGYISVESSPGNGATFRIYLPGSADPVGAATPRSASAPVGGAETILLVEDEASVRELAGRVLRAAGYDVVTAGDGEEALRAAGEMGKPIQLLLTDVVMPRMGGKELAEQLRSQGARVRTVFMSGYAEDVIAHRGVLEPGVTLLEKPFAPAALLRAVRDALDRRDPV